MTFLFNFGCNVDAKLLVVRAASLTAKGVACSIQVVGIVVSIALNISVISTLRSTVFEKLFLETTSNLQVFEP
jgi:hypothetical protein